jgi:hypothetical protein
MIKKAVAMRKHLEANRKDKDGKFHLILVSLPSHTLGCWGFALAAAAVERAWRRMWWPGQH